MTYFISFVSHFYYKDACSFPNAADHATGKRYFVTLIKHFNDSRPISEY